MKRVFLFLSFFLFLFHLSKSGESFCGFYVAKADTKLFNKASQVALARYEDKTVLTMANDFQGDPKEFAIVIPVPTVLQKDQIHIAEKALLDHLDAYSSPRLVEYFDGNPCSIKMRGDKMMAPKSSRNLESSGSFDRAKSLGVKIEAQYTIGEYDILILSAKESHGLETWLKESGYKIPQGASGILGSYLKQNMKFFVAKVNLKEQAKLGYTYLRPIQVAFESPKFMLPIRLGTVNANGPQELFIYTLTPKGRVETVNYRTVKLPTGIDLPPFVKDTFGDFYKAMFAEQVKKEDMRVLFTEYAWDMGWCDPCSADPLTPEELKNLGVFWQEDRPINGSQRMISSPFPPRPQATPNVFLTRLHVRYDAVHFPEDLVFQETADRENFQGRYVLRHPWTGTDQCTEAIEYRRSLSKRAELEAQNLASLTGWKIEEIRKKMNLSAPTGEEKKWYKKIWEK